MFVHFADNRCIELHSPDGVHSCILRASDSQEALVWFNALHSAMDNSTERALNDANRALVNIIGELKHIGWLSKRLGGSNSSAGGGTGSGPGSASSSGGGVVGTTSSAGNGCDQVRTTVHFTQNTKKRAHFIINFFHFRIFRVVDPVRRVQRKMINGNPYSWQSLNGNLGEFAFHSSCCG